MDEESQNRRITTGKIRKYGVENLVRQLTPEALLEAANAEWGPAQFGGSASEDTPVFPGSGVAQDADEVVLTDELLAAHVKKSRGGF